MEPGIIKCFNLLKIGCMAKKLVNRTLSAFCRLKSKRMDIKKKALHREMRANQHGDEQARKQQASAIKISHNNY